MSKFKCDILSSFQTLCFVFFQLLTWHPLSVNFFCVIRMIAEIRELFQSKCTKILGQIYFRKMQTNLSVKIEKNLEMNFHLTYQFLAWHFGCWRQNWQTIAEIWAFLRIPKYVGCRWFGMVLFAERDGWIHIGWRYRSVMKKYIRLPYWQLH